MRGAERLPRHTRSGLAIPSDDDVTRSAAAPRIAPFSCCARERPAHDLLDHLIRPLQQRRRDRQAEGLGRPSIDGQLEDGRTRAWRASAAASGAPTSPPYRAMSASDCALAEKTGSPRSSSNQKAMAETSACSADDDARGTRKAEMPGERLCGAPQAKIMARKPFDAFSRALRALPGAAAVGAGPWRTEAVLLDSVPPARLARPAARRGSGGVSSEAHSRDGRPGKRTGR